MGVVYRALDRLTGQVVAVKRVRMGKVDPMPSTSAPEETNIENMRLALIREFQTLAALRHPHIISVLDFGFDQNEQPYFVMEYLPEAVNLLEAGQGRAPVEKISTLIIPVLQALSYLHQRGIVHRDLKPGNILLTPQGVKVLDFGLATHFGLEESELSGTLTYMAPEILQGAPPTQASDIFSLGVLVAQLLGGTHPFVTPDVNLFVALLMSPPNLAAVVDPNLRTILEALLEKKPEQRLTDLNHILVRFCLALALPVPVEPEALVESVLQSVPLIGRVDELAHMQTALRDVLEGQGSVWLVGGESGVGKSRLLAELRIQALTRGLLTLHGSGVEEGGLPFQHWREALKHLALLYPPDEQQARALTALLPEMPALLQQPILPVGPSAWDQAVDVIAQMFMQLSQPVLILLEDLQWARESLEVLQRFATLARERGWLIVADYRNDEAPALPAQIPQAHLLTLTRLNHAEIEQLSQAMLGETDTTGPLTELLAQETEGNVFFVVEMMRELARQAGRLSDISIPTAPPLHLPQSVQAIIMRRLARIPSEGKRLLALAALYGRQLDPLLMRQLAPPSEMEAWLIACANAAILEFQQGGWRFNHDKLRAGVIASIATEDLPPHHETLAWALATLAETNPAYHAAAARHWELTETLEKARHHYLEAGEYAMKYASLRSACELLTKALEFTPAEARASRFQILIKRQEVHTNLGNRQDSLTDLEVLNTLVPRHPDPESAHIRAQIGWANYYSALEENEKALTVLGPLLSGSFQERPELREDYARMCLLNINLLGNLERRSEAAAWLAKAQAWVNELNSPPLQMELQRQWGGLYYYSGEYDRAMVHFTQAIDLSQHLGNRRAHAIYSQGLAAMLNNLGQIEQALHLVQTALSDLEAIGSKPGQANAVNTLGNIYAQLGNYPLGQQQYQRAYQLALEIQDKQLEVYALVNYLIISFRLGDFNPAHESLWSEALQMLDATHETRSMGIALSYRALSFLWQGKTALARATIQQALEIGQDKPNMRSMGYIYTNYGFILQAQQEYARALEMHQAALETRRKISQQAPMDDNLASLGFLYHLLGEKDRALQCLAPLTEKLLTGEVTRGTEDFPLVYLRCYQVLCNHHPAPAQQILEKGFQMLQTQVALFPNEKTRQTFLSQVPSNRELVQLYHIMALSNVKAEE
jgi:tetratricopeptide (TPR) repeat protein